MPNNKKKYQHKDLTVRLETYKRFMRLVGIVTSQKLRKVTHDEIVSMLLDKYEAEAE